MADGGGEIVVGIDGSGGAQRALAWALDEAGTHGDRVVLVQAWEFPTVTLTSFAGDTLPVFGRADIERVAAEELAKAAAAIKEEHPTIEIETRVVEGHPGSVLVEQSKDARLLVVGSRGRGGFKGMLMGSVSSSCAPRAHCPVVIVPPGAA
jgi:nucleotide-binding universal stress UspA family protein